MKKSVFAFVTAVLLVGCDEATEQPKVIPVSEALKLTNDECGRSKYVHLIGKSTSLLFDIPDVPSSSRYYSEGASVVIVANPKRLNFFSTGGYAAPEVTDPKLIGIFCG